MKLNVRLDSISDGKIYDINDFVRADAGGCNGCSACCQGVGDLVVLNPFDVFELTLFLKITWDELLIDYLTLQTDNKITLPHLKMQGISERCSFLNADDRCSVHAHRPDICRLFPLGRFYDEDDFKYFLQVKACVKPTLSMVKVEKWLGIDNYKAHKKFILSWYRLIKALSFRLKFVREEEELKTLNDILVNTFYKWTPAGGEDFYTTFQKRLSETKDKLGIIL